MAVSRAWKIFLTYLLFGKRMAWDKTMHDFPSTDQLAQQRMRLGELLATWQAVDAGELEQALNHPHQRQQQIPLGRILVSKGWLDDETLAEAIAFQSELPRARIDAGMVKAGASWLPAALCIRWRALPFARGEDHALHIAVANPLSAEALLHMRHAAGTAVRQFIVRESEIGAGLRLLGGADSTLPDSTPLLGDILIELDLVSRDAFETALDHYRPERDGRIGAYLVRRGVVPRAGIEQGLLQQRVRKPVARAGRIAETESA